MERKFRKFIILPLVLFLVLLSAKVESLPSKIQFIHLMGVKSEQVSASDSFLVQISKRST